MSNLLRKILGNLATRIMFVIYVLIILFATFFLIFGYYTQVDLHEQKQAQRLQAVVNTLALNMDGDMHDMLVKSAPEKDAITRIDQSPIYKMLFEQLHTAQKVNDLNSPMYTLVYDHEASLFRYVVRSDSQVYYLHNYVQFPEVLLNNMETGGFIPLYKSENGQWLSAFHPIRNTQGEVVALLEADIEFSGFISMVRTQYLKEAGIVLAVILAIALILIPYTRNILREDAKQKAELKRQRETIEEKNKSITDSINYAQRIQNAMLPRKAELRQLFNDCFVYYQAKDIVAGDFYWLEVVGDDIYFAVADCTGHGVPGAMVSVICANALNHAIRDTQAQETDAILEHVCDEVIARFDQGNKVIRDGMDICLCKINLKNNTLQYSGANNPLYLIRNGELQTFKASKQPIGHYVRRKPFEAVTIALLEGDCFYLFTDGYADQFGGELGKKFKYKPFKDLLVDIHQQPMNIQRDHLNRHFNNWMGTYEQIDDVCVVGIRI